MHQNIVTSRIAGYIFIACYAFFVFLMLKITLQYVPFNWNTAFLMIKKDYINIPLFRVAFLMHVFSSLFVLAAGFTQFSKHLRDIRPNLHRWMGKIYVLITLLFAGPSDLILGIYANGGISSKIGFCLLAVLWVTFTWLAFIKIRQGDVLSHREWMLRSFALALSAITLRAWKYMIVFTIHPKPMDVYRVVAWLGWTLNLVLVEIFILKFIKHEKKPSV
jgi:uncharacterized membrane protein